MLDFTVGIVLGVFVENVAKNTLGGRLDWVVVLVFTGVVYRVSKYS